MTFSSMMMEHKQKKNHGSSTPFTLVTYHKTRNILGIVYSISKFFI